MDPTLDTSSLFQSVPFPQMPGMAPRGGMFGGGKDWRSALLAAVAGFMSRRSPGVAGNIINGLQDAQTLKQRIALAQQERQQNLQDAMSLYDYKLAHPSPQQPATPGSMDALRAEYLDPNTSPERKAQLEPIVLQPQLQMVPGLGLVSIPRTPQAPPKPLTDDDILRMGGQAGGGSPGGFL